jgi:hypothetical protein
MGKDYVDTPFDVTLNSVPEKNPSRDWEFLDVDAMKGKVISPSKSRFHTTQSTNLNAHRAMSCSETHGVSVPTTLGAIHSVCASSTLFVDHAHSLSHTLYNASSLVAFMHQ